MINHYVVIVMMMILLTNKPKMIGVQGSKLRFFPHPCVVYNRNNSGELFLLYTTQGCHTCFIIPNNIQNTKGEK